MEKVDLKTNTEVREPGSKRKRRYHTADYKLDILRQADACRGKAGAIGELLRREGIYSSTLAEWRKQRDEGGLSALSKIRGRRPKFSAIEIENQRLKRLNEQLEEKLRQSNLIIEAQKKISEILGIVPANGDLP
jgi:transposase